MVSPDETICYSSVYYVPNDCLLCPRLYTERSDAQHTSPNLALSKLISHPQLEGINSLFNIAMDT